MSTKHLMPTDDAEYVAVWLESMDKTMGDIALILATLTGLVAVATTDDRTGSPRQKVAKAAFEVLEGLKDRDWNR